MCSSYSTVDWSALSASGVTRDMTRYLGRWGYVNRYHGILRDIKIIISSGKTSGRHINDPSSSDRIVQLHNFKLDLVSQSANYSRGERLYEM